MELSLTKEEYRCLKKSFETVLEETPQAELSLPDYLPEILKIVKTTANVSIHSCVTVGERLSVEGCCEFRLLYCGADGGLYASSQTVPFSRNCENEAFASADDVAVSATVNYVNCRATAPKRAEIRAGMGLKIAALCKEAEEILSLPPSSGIEELSVPVSACTLCCKKSRTFSMSETFENTGSPAAFLLHTGAVAILGEVKKISNKIMLKGEVVLEISFVPASDHKCVETVRHTLPINQILEFEGMEEQLTGDTVLRVLALEVTLKNDAGGEGKLFDASLSISAGITMWEQRDYFVIRDAYAVRGEAALSRRTLRFYSPRCEIREPFLHKDSITLPSPGYARLLQVSHEEGVPTATMRDGQLAITGSIKLSLLVCEESGEISCLERMTDYCFLRSIEETEQLFCTPQVTVCSLDCTLKGKDCVEVRAELQVEASVFSVQQIDAVSDISLLNEDSCPESCFTVYFPECEESLWKIARQYHTTVAAIAEENNLAGETTGELRMLLIPTVF